MPLNLPPDPRFRSDAGILRYNPTSAAFEVYNAQTDSWEPAGIDAETMNRLGANGQLRQVPFNQTVPAPAGGQPQGFGNTGVPPTVQQPPQPPAVTARPTDPTGLSGFGAPGTGSAVTARPFDTTGQSGFGRPNVTARPADPTGQSGFGRPGTPAAGQPSGVVRVDETGRQYDAQGNVVGIQSIATGPIPDSAARAQMAAMGQGTPAGPPPAPAAAAAPPPQTEADFAGGVIPPGWANTGPTPLERRLAGERGPGAWAPPPAPAQPSTAPATQPAERVGMTNEEMLERERIMGLIDRGILSPESPLLTERVREYAMGGRVGMNAIHGEGRDRDGTYGGEVVIHPEAIRSGLVRYTEGPRVDTLSGGTFIVPLPQHLDQMARSTFMDAGGQPMAKARGGYVPAGPPPFAEGGGVPDEGVGSGGGMAGTGGLVDVAPPRGAPGGDWRGGFGAGSPLAQQAERRGQTQELASVARPETFGLAGFGGNPEGGTAAAQAAAFAPTMPTGAAQFAALESSIAPPPAPKASGMGEIAPGPTAFASDVGGGGGGGTSASIPYGTVYGADAWRYAGGKPRDPRNLRELRLMSPTQRSMYDQYLASIGSVLNTNDLEALYRSTATGGLRGIPTSA